MASFRDSGDIIATWLDAGARFRDSGDIIATWLDAGALLLVLLVVFVRYVHIFLSQLFPGIKMPSL